MTDIEDFNLLVEKAMSEKKFHHMRPVVAKELLHYDILFSLENDGLLDQLTFQGGTIEDIVYSPAFMAEMSRFIPMDVQDRTLKKPKFLEFLINENKALLKDLDKLLYG